jgi:hypothetical protein
MADEPDNKPSRRNVSTKAIQRATRIANDRKHALKAANTELETLRATNAELAKRPTTEALEKENQALQAKLRTQAHRAAFDSAAREAGVHPSAFEDAFDSAVKAGYKVEGDTANPELVKASIAGVKEAKPFLFAPAQESKGGDSNANPNPALTRKPIESKGNPVPTPVAGQIKRSDLRDPLKALTLDPVAIGQAIKEGTIIDDV